MTLSQSQLSSISFVTQLRRIDQELFEEMYLEYAQDASSSFSVDAFLSQDEEFKEEWVGCDKAYFFQLLEQEAHTVAIMPPTLL